MVTATSSAITPHRFHDNGERKGVSIEEIPSEILKKIGSYLLSGDLLSMERVCRRWRSITAAIRFDRALSLGWSGQIGPLFWAQNYLKRLPPAVAHSGYGVALLPHGARATLPALVDRAPQETLQALERQFGSAIYIKRLLQRIERTKSSGEIEGVIQYKVTKSFFGLFSRRSIDEQATLDRFQQMDSRQIASFYYCNDLIYAEKNSPLSISALFLERQGAAGANGRQMDKVIDYLLTQAVLHGNKEAFELFFRSRGNIHRITSDGFSLLRHAIMRGDEEAAQLLLDKGAAITLKDLDFAKHRGLVSYETWKSRFHPNHAVAAIDYRALNDRLFTALRANNRVAANAALQAGADPNGRDGSGLTPLHHSFHTNNIDEVVHMTRLLLAFGANPNLADRQGKVPLHLAIGRMGDLEYAEDPRQILLVISQLLTYGADPNKADDKGHTPLHWAKERCREANHQKTAFSCFLTIMTGMSIVVTSLSGTACLVGGTIVLMSSLITLLSCLILVALVFAGSIFFSTALFIVMKTLEEASWNDKAPVYKALQRTVTQLESHGAQELPSHAGKFPADFA